jgi:hypothetical protein
MDLLAPAEQTAKTPFNVAWLTYLWVLLLSIWGGVVSYISKVRSGQCSRFNLTELIGDITTSGFVGLLTFWLCQATHLNEWVTAVFIGISGHMGARALLKFELYMAKRIGLDNSPPSDYTPR